jgi:hypothetical protein
MADNKTQATAADVGAFLDAVADPARRADAHALADLMTKVSAAPAKMWGPSIVGFGRYHYRYESGREGEMCRLGFSPRKAELVLYVLNDTPEQAAQLARLGKHRRGKGCLYIKRLADVDIGVLEALVRGQLAHMDARYPR